MMRIGNITLSDVIVVEPALTSNEAAGEGGSPVVNADGAVVGMIVARTIVPSRSIVVAIGRIRAEFASTLQ
jgi:hypothetical protein